MLKVNKTRNGNILTVKIQGPIAEDCDFDSAFGELPAELIVNCKEISRITSSGTRSWVTYFNDVTRRGIKLRFEECSPATIEQCNLISNFTCGGKIVSGYLPYSCQSCHQPFLKLLGIRELKAIVNMPPSYPCPKCGKQSVFDDLPDEYFRFLTRS